MSTKSSRVSFRTAVSWVSLQSAAEMYTTLKVHSRVSDFLVSSGSDFCVGFGFGRSQQVPAAHLSSNNNIAVWYCIEQGLNNYC